MSDTTPGWQPDPTGKHDHRYWDGSRWTDDVADAGVAGTDPFEAAAPEVPVVEEPAAPEGPVGEEPTAPEVPAADEPVATEPVATELVATDETLVDQAVPSADATDTYPAATDEPAAWSTAPAPPPPYVPTEPVAGADDSKKRLLIGGGILAAVVLAVIAFLALGGDDDDPATEKASQSSDTTDNTDSTEPSDTTGGGGGEGSYGSDPELDELYDSCEEGVYADCDLLYFDSPSGSEYQEFGDTCGNRNEPGELCAKLYADDGGEDDGGDTGGLPDGVELPDDYRQQLAEIYQTTFDLSTEQSECLAGKLVDAIEGGTVSEDQATSEVLDYLSDCDITLEEIGAN
jgi:hypothetical protein